MKNMKNTLFSKFAAVLTVGVVSFAAAPSVKALSTSALWLEDNLGNTVTILDDGPGDSSPGLGVIVFNGSLGGTSPWTVNVTTGLSRPVLGAVDNPHMDLNSVNVTTLTGGGTLYIRFSDVGFGPNSSSGNPLTEIGGTTNGTLLYETFADATNTLFGTGSALSTLGAFGSGAFSGTSGAAGFPAVSPYSLTQQVTITHTGAGQATSFNASLSVPEGGATLTLLGGVLLGIGVLRRKLSNVA